MHVSQGVRHVDILFVVTNNFVCSLRDIKQLRKLKNKTKPNKSNNPKYQYENIN